MLLKNGELRTLAVVCASFAAAPAKAKDALEMEGGAYCSWKYVRK